MVRLSGSLVNGNWSQVYNSLRKQAGNAVPVPMVRSVIREVMKERGTLYVDISPHNPTERVLLHVDAVIAGVNNHWVVAVNRICSGGPKTGDGRSG